MHCTDETEKAKFKLLLTSFERGISKVICVGIPADNVDQIPHLVSTWP